MSKTGGPSPIGNTFCALALPLRQPFGCKLPYFASAEWDEVSSQNIRVTTAIEATQEIALLDACRNPASYMRILTFRKGLRRVCKIGYTLYTRVPNVGPECFAESNIRTSSVWTKKNEKNLTLENDATAMGKSPQVEHR